MSIQIIYNLLKTTVIAVVFLLCASASIAKNDTTSADSSHKIYNSLIDETGFPSTQAKQNFDCSDKIYTVVELQNYASGKHQLSIKWIDPAGDLREHTQYPFYVVKQDTRLWAWLNLYRATGAGMLQWIDPAAGLEEFIGSWTIEIRVDNKRLSKQKFEVIC
jgi:hypothetical protein